MNREGSYPDYLSLTYNVRPARSFDVRLRRDARVRRHGGHSRAATGNTSSPTANFTGVLDVRRGIAETGTDGCAKRGFQASGWQLVPMVPEGRPTLAASIYLDRRHPAVRSPRSGNPGQGSDRHQRVQETSRAASTLFMAQHHARHEEAVPLISSSGGAAGTSPRTFLERPDPEPKHSYGRIRADSAIRIDAPVHQLETEI